MELPTPLPSARVLVAEDDAIQAAVICDLLQKEGYQIESCATIAETREAVRARTPDLLLLDRMFPEGDGCLLCQELKASPATQGLPIIMLTARDRVEDRVEGLLRGADDYIPKPFHPREFLARVHSCLRTLALQREIKHKADELARKHQVLVETQERLVRSERLAALGEIGLAIRHEINNPLGTILGFVDLLLTQADTLPDAARKKLDVIRKATIRIRDVVRRLEEVEDRSVEYVPGLQMTDLGDRPPEPPEASAA
jgi:DNA-binding response OmpR family regulator